jgi:hypothetical protein
MVQRIAGTSHQVEVHNMHRADVAARAKQYGIDSVPGIVIDGVLAKQGLDEAALRSAIGG